MQFTTVQFHFVFVLFDVDWWLNSSVCSVCAAQHKKQVKKKERIGEGKEKEKEKEPRFNVCLPPLLLKLPLPPCVLDLLLDLLLLAGGVAAAACPCGWCCCCLLMVLLLLALTVI